MPVWLVLPDKRHGDTELPGLFVFYDDGVALHFVEIVYLPEQIVNCLVKVIVGVYVNINKTFWSTSLAQETFIFFRAPTA